MSVGFCAELQGYSPLCTEVHLAEDEEPEPMRIETQLVPTVPQQASTDTILQFTSAVYFAEEEEGKVVIDVMRLGNQTGRSSCFFSTSDGSGKAGERYEAIDGQLVFGPGVMRQTIEVGIVQGDSWEATLEFGVTLTDPEDCILGAYLHACRVKVIDTDTFPTSKYPEVVKGMETIKLISAFALFWEYCKMNFGVKGIAWRTCLSLVMDQLRNLYIFYKLSAMAFMLNVVFANTDKDPSFTVGEREQIALWIGAGYILPMVALHAWDLVKSGLDIRGHSRCFLQTSVVRKYLNYDEQSRSEVRITEIQCAIREDAGDMAEGYMAVLSLLQLTGKLFVMLTFTLQENPDALTTVIIMPALMLIWGCCRKSALTNASEKSDDLAQEMLDSVQDMHANYRLISNYQQRPKINDTFAQKASAWRLALLSPHIVRINNEYFTQWLGPVFVGIYIMTQAHNVLSGVLGHGTFVATLSVFGEISGDFSEGYKELMKISSIADGLQGMTELLNRKTDLMSWKQVNRQRRETTKRARETHVNDSANAAHPFPTDLIPIQFKGMGFQFPAGKRVLKDVDLSVPQGSMVAIELGDSHGGGRQTFLRLIAHEIFPTEGEVFIPTHLRILHVSQEPLILDASLLHNLKFGCNRDDDHLERVRNILRRFGNLATDNLIRETQQHTSASDDDDGDDDDDAVTEDLSDSEDAVDQRYSLNCYAGERSDESEDDAESSWQKTLSHTERVDVHLARAFIMNPEVMVLQRPLLHFSPGRRDKVLELIREHVNNRGLGLPPGTASSRRPRTVFVSVETTDHSRRADVVWQMVQQENGTSTVHVKRCHPSSIHG